MDLLDQFIKRMKFTKKSLLAFVFGIIIIPSVALAQISVNQGGTGQTDFTADQILYGVSSLRLGSEAAFTYDPSTNTLAVDSVSLGDDTIAPDDLLAAGQTDEYCLTYEATGDTWEWQTCGSGGGGGGDNLSIDSSAVVDPDFVSSGDIDFVNTSNTITADINAGVIVNADINASAAIAYSKLSLAGSIDEPDLDADVAAVDGDYLQYDSTGTNFTWRSASEVKTDLSLNNVENTALSTWAGTTNITTLGTITTGTWQGTVITDSFLSDTITVGASGSVSDSALSANVSLLGTSIASSEITDETITHTDILDSDQADTKCAYIEDPTDTDDFNSLWANKTSNDFLITEIWGESDQTVSFDLQVDDGTPADVSTVDIAPAAGEAEDTSLTGDTTVAAGEELDLAITSVTNTPTWLSLCFTGNWVD